MPNQHAALGRPQGARTISSPEVLMISTNRHGQTTRLRAPRRGPVLLMAAVFCAAVAIADEGPPSPDAVERAARNGALAARGLAHCHRYLHAWLRVAEPTTGLIPRNLTNSPYWNGKDSAADNYPFMVLSAFFTDRPLLESEMRRMLVAEQRLTARPGWGRLTDDYSLRPPLGLLHEKPDPLRIFFNSAEYVKDGLLPLTEWLGPSPWSERMLGLIDDSFLHAAVETPFGRVPVLGRNKEPAVEINGDYLQALARLYWMQGQDERYLRWGVRIASTYLLPEGRHHPTRDFNQLVLGDHSCEIVAGLCEFYATLALAGARPGNEEWQAVRERFRPHLHEILDRILTTAVNPDGLLYLAIDPQQGSVTDRRITDSWGYVFNGFYTVYLIDGKSEYREACLRALGSLEERYRSFNWQPDPSAHPTLGSQDGYADSIEGALNLANRALHDPRAVSALRWVDSEILELWSRQRPDGLIERWHGDGNFARTTLLYCLWKSQGAHAHPWREDLRVGAVRQGDALVLVIESDTAWSGNVRVDYPRHAEVMKLPIDWPRINQFPEWYTVQSDRSYRLEQSGTGVPQTVSGASLRSGLPIETLPGQRIVLRIRPVE